MGLSDLPLASGRRHKRAFKRLGFRNPPGRPGKGDHEILKHADGRLFSLPMHKEVKRGTLMGILNEVGLSEDEYLRAFR